MKWKPVSALFILPLFVGLFLSVASLSGPPNPILTQGAEWHIETVDASSHVEYASLAVDSDGNPHIAYNDWGALKYANWTEDGWKSEVVEIDSVMYGISIALDNADNPHISYHDVAMAELKYAKWTGSNWSINTANSDGMAGLHSSIAIDNLGKAHISYYNALDGSLNYVVGSGTSWTKRLVYGSAFWSSIALDGSGTPHISFYDNQNNDLKCAKWTGSWSIDSVDTVGDVGAFNSLVFDSKGVPHISYFDGSTADLKYANKTGGSWKNITVDAGGWVGEWTSIAIDGNDYPHMSYQRFYNFTASDLKYANWTGSGWNVETVDSGGEVGEHSSIGLDAGRNPHIGYIDEGVTGLKYATIAKLGPRPPMLLQAVLNGSNFQNLTMSWTLSADDEAGFGSVVSYEILRNGTYDSNGVGYQIIASLPNKTYEFTDSFVGEGDPSSYFYRVCALDLDGNNSCSKTQVAKFTRPLSKGPNLISIPLIQSDETMQTVLQTLSFDNAWSYDPVNQEWKSFMKSKPYGQSLEYLNHTKGIWVNVTQDSNLTVAGVVPTSTTIDLQAGWNLVGFPSFDSNFSVADLKAAVILDRIEGFDGLAPPYFLRVMGDADFLQAGFGYWIRVGSMTSWAIGNP